MIWDFPVESLISVVCNIPTMRFDYVGQINDLFDCSVLQILKIKYLCWKWDVVFLQIMLFISWIQ